MDYSFIPKTKQLLSEKLGKKIFIEEPEPVSGGCINDCFVLTTSVGKFFLKRNVVKAFPKMFEAEARGLELLNSVVQGITPKVILTVERDDADEQLLILEWIQNGKAAMESWNDFARRLSLLHQHTFGKFGWEYNNYMGSLPQNNEYAEEWISFFILRRIEPQLKKAIDEKNLPKEIHRSFEKLFSTLTAIFPPAKPSLLHGDLWSGNFMIGADGLVRLIDPAVYYGHREMDLAMTKLFGGFDRSFYLHYHEHFPIEPGFEKRSDVYNLYPLLIHVNLFGGHYADDVMAIIKKFA